MGHLVCAEEARFQFELDTVIFMVAGEPALKDSTEVSPAEDRYWMTMLATADNEDFEVSRLEIDRPGTTYTIDTLRELQTILGPDDELFFITGADAVLDIMKWKDADKIAELATFICATRPGYEITGDAPTVPKNLDLKLMEVPALSISSSDLRKRFREGDSVRYLVPEEVEHYIREAGLYV
jgi:nicotinate-nucleotide adenylyltransferase